MVGGVLHRRGFRVGYGAWVVEPGQRGGAGEDMGLLKLAGEVGESHIEVMLGDFLSPPYPAWSVGELRRILQPEPKPQIELIELQPECRSYDALLSPELEVAYGT